MALRAFFFFSDKDGKDMETLAQSKTVKDIFSFEVSCVSWDGSFRHLSYL